MDTSTQLHKDIGRHYKSIMAVERIKAMVRVAEPSRPKTVTGLWRAACLSSVSKPALAAAMPPMRPRQRRQVVIRPDGVRVDAYTGEPV